MLPYYLLKHQCRKEANNNKLQGSVATCLRCDGDVSNQIKKGLLLSLSVKKIKIREYFEKWQARMWLSRALYSFFYRAMLCIRGTSHGPVSVRLSVRPSVTSRCSTKTAKRRITQTTPHDSPWTLHCVSKKNKTLNSCP